MHPVSIRYSERRHIPGRSLGLQGYSREDQEFMTALHFATVHVPVYRLTLVQCTGFGTTLDALLLMY